MSATAAYNFISLPVKAIPAPMNEKIAGGNLSGDSEIAEVQEDYRSYIAELIKAEDAFSGRIEIKLRTETPCFIGGNDGDEEAFFSPYGTPVIPGSTLRGMVKNILKIITCGTMRAEEDYHNRKLYSRNMAGFGGTHKDWYMKRLDIRNTGKKESSSGADAGFLVMNEEGRRKKYYIIPASYESIYDPSPNGKGDSYSYEFSGAYGNPVCEFYTGKMSTKKHYIRIAYPDWDSRIEVPDDIIKNYAEDEKRGNANTSDRTNATYRRWSMLERMEEPDEKIKARNRTGGRYEAIIPCFYMIKDGCVDSFGAGPFYRISYERAIGDNSHIPQEVQSDIVDFADALFGRKEYWAGRVFFEDAVCKHAVSLTKGYSHVLLSPNPTAFQLYLEKKPNGKYNHWDDDAKIRGYKMYWHRKCNDSDGDDGWRKSDGEAAISGAKKLTPLAAGNEFTSFIRFRNLSMKELGALLAVFDLAKTKPACRYKVGHGKSLGLGTVSIEASLQIVDTQQAYGSLMQGQKIASIYQDAPDLYGKALEEYQRYMAKENECTGNTEQYSKILEELQYMMDWEHVQSSGVWNPKIRIMKLTDAAFKNKDPLKTVKEIKAEMEH